MVTLFSKIKKSFKLSIMQFSTFYYFNRKHLPWKAHSSQNLILASLNLDLLEILRTKFNIHVLYNLLHNNDDSLGFLQKLNFHVPPCSVRSITIFHILHQRSNYALNTPFNRLMLSVNLSNIDIFVFTIIV